MKIQDIKHSDNLIIELTTSREVKIKNKIPIKLIERSGTILIIPYNNEFEGFEVKGKDKKNQEFLDKIISRNLPRLSTVIGVINKNNIIIEVKSFVDQKPMDLSIGVEEKFLDKIEKKIKINDIRNPEASLNESFILNINDIKYCVIGVNANIKDENYKGFVISGKEGYIQIKQDIKDEKSYFIAEKVLSRVDKNNYKFYLVKGNLEFVNETLAEKARQETLLCIQDIGNSIEGYLNSWEEYGEIEKELIVNKAINAGVLTYINSEYSPDNGTYRLDLKENSNLKRFLQQIDDNSAITLFSIDPTEMLNLGLTIEKYKIFVKEDKERVIGNLRSKEGANSNRIFIKCNKQESIPPSRGYIMLSLDGDVSRFSRRNESRKKIMTAQSYMPHLAAILEGKSVHRSQSKRIEPLSAAVKEELFPKHDPTIKQREAIEVALNTPDIAIIQGPPGTGKTTVILAILKRLNEISDSSESIFGRNLISAFQHDAVINAVERVEMLGLPAVKIGKKSGEADNEPEVIEQIIENWISNKDKLLKSRHKSIVKDSYLSKFDNIHKNYLHSANTLENTISLLEETKNLVSTVMKQDLVLKIDILIDELKQDSTLIDDDIRDEMLKYIYGIPYTKQAYSDCGEDKLMEVIFILKRYEKDRFKDEIIAIQEIIRNYNESSEQLSRLRSIRKKILLELIPKENIFSTPKQNEAVLKLFSQISDEIRNQYYKTVAGENQVLMDYISTYDNNPLAIRNAVMEYTSVLGATNQQAKGRLISSLKGDAMYYDNVLVDEAARSNPLDLFIPMALAKDRIILVGDHRQLPHIVEEKIKKNIEKKVTNDNDLEVWEKVKGNIEKSMFEHLFETLKKLEKQDGIIRTVTLDKQYRTHRVLGDFISKNFYEKHGQSHIGSDLPYSEFSHNIKGLENKACVWMEVPISRKEESREIKEEESRDEETGSKYREAEAREIVNHLEKIIETENTKEMSFGIITFYSKQVKVIYEQLVKKGIAIKNDSGAYEILPKYKEGEKNGKKFEKLRIGTVDSFQGMEFDVVYLSIVRCNEFGSSTPEQLREKYGFLSIENRLCVSMSRQKKMLIVAGDSSMLYYPNAEKAIQPLINYYELCKNKENYGEII